MSNFYTGEEICIVGIGCVLPDASSVDEFWKNVKDGKCSISDLFEDGILDKNLYLDKTRKVDNKTYSAMAAYIKDKDVLGAKNKAYYMLSEASKQALHCLKNRDISTKNVDIYLGCMESDQFLSSELIIENNRKIIVNYLQEKKKSFNLEYIKSELHLSEFTKDEASKATLMSSILCIIKKEFGIKKGKRAIIDSACASSLTAIDVSIKVLKNNEVDMVITGGIDSNLGPEAFVAFSAAGALSEERCLPFDKSASGISLGEGAVIFVLQKLKNALKDNNTVYGILRDIGSSSDGNASSIFSPSLSGQKLCLERAYKNTDINNIAYVECHGTGTKIGDTIEFASLNYFFSQRKNKMPVGSVKGLVGHTRGAAGAVGILKSLFILNTNLIPATRYIQESIEESGSKVFVNKKEIKLKDTTPLVGISSFGFGNINYHLILEKFLKENVENNKFLDNATVGNKNIVLIGESLVDISDIDHNYISNNFKILPNMIDQVDEMQLLSLLAVERAIKKYNLSFFDTRDDVKVVSASCTGLKLMISSSCRIKSNELVRVRGFSFKDVENLKDLISKANNINRIKEDMSFGQLNNVLADRISNFFNFRGKNFNVDSDFNSIATAVDIARRELSFEDGVVIVISPNEELSESKTLLKRSSMRCFIFSSLEYAKDKNYPILEENVNVVYKN